MTITYVHDPDADPDLRQTAVCLNRPTAGIVAFAAQPGGRRDLWLYHSILDALGKTSDERSLIERARSHAGVYAAAWLTAHNIEHLVVYDTPNITTWNFGALCLLAEACHLDVTIVADGAVSDGLRRQIDRWADHTTDPAEHLTELDDLYPPSPPPPVAATDPYPTVADADYATWLTATRHQLGDTDDYRRVHRLYVAVWHQFRDVDVDDDTVAKTVADRVVATRNPDEQTTIIRAAQAALFTRGWALNVDLPGVLRHSTATRTIAGFTDADWANVVTVARPRLPALVALAATGIPETDLAALPGAAVADDATTVTYRNETRPIPEPAQVAVRAQHLVRAAFGNSPDDPYLADSVRHDVRDIRDQLTRLRSIAGHHTRLRYTATTHHWQYRTGITLTDLHPKQRTVNPSHP